MVELQPVGVRQERLQVRRRIVASLPEADEVLVPLAVGQLDEAQPVAPGDQAHRFGVDCDRPVREAQVFRQVFLVKMDGHSISSAAWLTSALVRLAPAIPALWRFSHWSAHYFSCKRVNRA